MFLDEVALQTTLDGLGQPEFVDTRIHGNKSKMSTTWNLVQTDAVICLWSAYLSWGKSMGFFSLRCDTILAFEIFLWMRSVKTAYIFRTSKTCCRAR